MITNFAIFNLNFPSNTLYLYNIISQIANFNLIPSDIFYNYLLTFDDSNYLDTFE